MEGHKNGSPPDLELPIAKAPTAFGEQRDDWLLWIAGAIAILVVLLILLATIVSLSSPPTGSASKGLGLGADSPAQKDAVGNGTGDGEATKGNDSSGNSDNQQSKPTLSKPANSAVSPQPEANTSTEKQNPNRETERNTSIESKGIDNVAAEGTTAGEYPEDKLLAGVVSERNAEDAFMINLPERSKIPELTPPSKSVVATSRLSQRSANERLQKLEENGGTEGSELAVAAALEWLAKHQLPNGQWSFDHKPSCDGTCSGSSQTVHADTDPRMLANAATGLGLLPFLGAGFTHRDGKYKDVVRKGINYLLESQQRDSTSSKLGSWMEFTGVMYSHGIASMAICEAYAMTEDSKLKPVAQKGLNFTAMAQHQDGGWRYQPGEPGDMSMLGWHLMALKSGQLAELPVDKRCFFGAEKFIDSLRIAGSGAYGYQSPSSDGDDQCTTAIGALGLYYLGRDNQSVEQKSAVKLIIQSGPDVNDLYGLYYSTQVMMHLGGDDWPAWNGRVREHLISSQAKAGHENGSWFVPGGPHRTGAIGGRMYCTAVSAMILEVYYRHLPLYLKKRQ
jgi:hypothetical protein